MSVKTKPKKKNQRKKVFLEANISSSQCSGSELYYFLNCEYFGIESFYSVEEESIENLIEEAFRFIMPDGVPDYFKYFTSTDNSWKSISSLMCDEFLQNKIIKWQMSKHSLDYRKASEADIEKQRLKLGEAYEESVSDSAISLDSRIEETATAAIQLHNMLNGIEDENEMENVTKKSVKHDKVKGNLYNIIRLLNIPCKINGDARSVFLHPTGRRLVQHLFTTFVSTPDALLYILEGKGLSNTALEVEEVIYPFLIIEVHGPSSEDVIAVSSESSQVEKSDSDSDSDKEGVTNRLQKMSVSLKKNAREMVANPEDYYEQEHRSSRRTFKAIIARESPIQRTKEMQLAFRKSTGQLPLDMYGSLLDKMCVKFEMNSIDLRKDSQTVGLFVINERIYLEKIVEKNRTGRMIFREIKKPLTTSMPPAGPKVYLADWYFDLRIPNHRIAFQAVLFYLKLITHYELKNMQQSSL